MFDDDDDDLTNIIDPFERALRLFFVLYRFVFPDSVLKNLFELWSLLYFGMQESKSYKSSFVSWNSAPCFGAKFYTEHHVMFYSRLGVQYLTLFIMKRKSKRLI